MQSLNEDQAERPNAAIGAGVVIVGGGPVGLTVALSLARYGIPSTVLEADSTVCRGSRAICLSRRTLQILRRLHIDQVFLDKGLPWREGRSYLGVEEIYWLRMPHGDHERFSPFINLQQYHVEQFLVDACEATGLVDIRWNNRVIALKQHPAGVTLDVEGQAGTQLCEAGWVIAADGARSFIRETGLGISLEGHSFESRYLIADIELDCDWPTERKVWFDPSSNPGSTVIMHRQPDGVWRIDYQLLPGEDAEEALHDDNIRARISAHLDLVGLPNEWTLLWKSLYRAHTLSLRDYVHDRIAFVGDAAHLLPIFGVRGLNSGIEDAANVAWKLAAVINGVADSTFMGSYTAERRSACLENIETATKSTWFMSPPSAGFVLTRDAVLELATVEPHFGLLLNPRQSTAHRYKSDGAANSPVLGLPLCEVCLADGRHLDDLVGDGFAGILFIAANETSQVHDEGLVGGINFRLVTVNADDPAVAALNAKSGSFFLVRPDGYVGAVETDVTLATMLQTASRALGEMGLTRFSSNADLNRGDDRVG